MAVGAFLFGFASLMSYHLAFMRGPWLDRFWPGQTLDHNTVIRVNRDLPDISA